MESEVKQRNQRNRRRERAQRMQAQRESKVKDGDSGEDESPAREKPPRPPVRRKKSREPLGEEDIIDGFAIMAFRTYEDLEAAVKCVSSPRTNSLSIKPRLPLSALPSDATRNHPPNNVNSHGITLIQDAGTSDDSGRASERLTGSSVAPRDPDSSRDRLSDASSRCSSGKGYICDSEDDDDKASPDNSRNASPRYQDATMEDVSDTGPLFRVTGAGVGAGGGGKNELVARGGSGGALALSRAPVGGSASPAPAPLPQPAPSPAPAALPPPALPPPPFRADTPHRSNGAHIPALEGHAATQIPARPVGAAGPDTPERPASNNKLQPGARATADSPTPAPPAPPAPSPLFPSHSAYQSHAAAALPDYRHTNHETRTEPTVPHAAAPLDLHAHHAPRPTLVPPAPMPAPHPTSLPSRIPHSQPQAVLTGHELKNTATTPSQTHPSTPTSFQNRVNGMSQNVQHSTPVSISNCLPSQTQVARPNSPNIPTCRAYPSSIGSSHVNSSVNSSILNHSIPYQSQPNLQKHSVQPVHPNRSLHLPPFSVAGHTIQSLTSTPSLAVTHTVHALSTHSIMNHANHLIANTTSSLVTTVPSPIGSSLSLPPTTTSTISSYASSQKHSGLPPHSNHMASPVSTPIAVNHVDGSPSAVLAPNVHPVTGINVSHSLPPPVVDSRQAVVDTRQAVVDSRQAVVDTRQAVVDSRQAVVDSRQAVVDTRQTVVDSRQAAVDSRQAMVSSNMSARTASPVITSTLASNGYPPPAVYSSANYPPLYAPYASTLQHSPYLPPAAPSPRNIVDTRPSLTSSPLVAPKTPKGVRPHTPGSLAVTSLASTMPAPQHVPHAYSPSPTRERESFSNISSLSRSGNTPASSGASTLPMSAPLAPTLAAPLATPLAAPLAAPLGAPLTAPLGGPLSATLPAPGSLVPGLAAPLAAPTPTPAAPTHLAHSLAPVPTVPSISSSAKPPAHWGVTRPTAPDRSSAYPTAPLFGAPMPPPNPNPFSAESLFQTSPGADLLRRELDNRFLAAAGGVVRTEMHHHQHQHTHVHAHATHAAHATQPHHHAAPHHPHQLLVPHAPLFKDVGKIPSLYRTGLGLGYPYSSSLLHPAAPYVPPAPLTTYAPKPVVSAASEPTTKPPPPPPRPAVAKTGKWNAMHVRIAWEIYNHQQKDKSSGSSATPGAADKDKLRAFPAPAPPPPTYRSPYDLQPSPYLPHHPHLSNAAHLTRTGHSMSPFPLPTDRGLRFSGVSPFARYGAGAYPTAPTTFGLSAYGRELGLPASLHGVHHGPQLNALHDAWRARPPPPTDARRELDERERERARRERDERERREREERERRKAREQRDREFDRVRARSPLRNGAPEPPKDERKEPPRPPPPTLSAYPPPPTWDPYRSFDPLQHMRFAPFVEAAIRAEEDRAKMLSVYAHHQQLKSSPLLHRGLPPHGPLPPLGAMPPLAPPLAPLAPLAPLDLLKKEEPR